jgi:hypothetical protein
MFQTYSSVIPILAQQTMMIVHDLGETSTSYYYQSSYAGAVWWLTFLAEHLPIALLFIRVRILLIVTGWQLVRVLIG